MNSSALETYLAGVDPAAAPLVVALDVAIRRAYPNFVASRAAASASRRPKSPTS